MYRSDKCGDLRLTDLNKKVVLAGWVSKIRKMGGMTFIDLRDRYGITQLSFNQETDRELFEQANGLGREWVIRVTGEVKERSSKNKNIATGDIEIEVEEVTVLNASKNPPFTIETNSDGGDELRMKYRYLDLRRSVVRNNLVLRHKMALETRRYLDERDFLEVETPMLIGSTPEGARDFIVPSRMNPGQFYALPQSPQLFKQLLMVSGFDRYFQIVKCFRDEDLRADRQPEFTQIDCEMSFVEQEDVLNTFEGLTKHLFKAIKGIEIADFQRISYHDAMRLYGSDKPDTRFEMTISEIKDLTAGAGFNLLDSAEYVGAICAEGCADYTRREIDEITEFVKRPQIGAKGVINVRYNSDGNIKSSVDKFYTPEKLKEWAERCNAKPGDLILIMAGNREKTETELGELRLEMANRLGLKDKGVYKCLWVVDFPLLEKDNDLDRYFAKHHPFTSPKQEDIPLLKTNPDAVRANAYDLVINGVEIGGGSIRIHDRNLQKQMFSLLGFTDEQAQAQFGFLMDAFQYGAPPHGGIAFGLDRFVSIFAALDSIRDTIAFPKNTAGRDVMIDAPSEIASEQLDELSIMLKSKI